MKLKLGQVFWQRDTNEYDGTALGRSDFECKVVGVKLCTFIDGTGFTDYLIKKTRLNGYHGYHEYFKTKESRTVDLTFRYDHDDKTIKYWHEQYWPGHVTEWRDVEEHIYKKKPKGLRKGP